MFVGGGVYLGVGNSRAPSPLYDEAQILAVYGQVQLQCGLHIVRSVESNVGDG